MNKTKCEMCGQGRVFYQIDGVWHGSKYANVLCGVSVLCGTCLNKYHGALLHYCEIDLTNERREGDSKNEDH